ncbi:MAG: cyclophilin-like superfamily protein [Rhodobacteraceae bacterium]|nr:cyclophilin-like superfamily protein [Paracoccaceae bacterium]MBR28918.1 cyclophilin-like superfamily protein [Paracoccaceae bacterium]
MTSLAITAGPFRFLGVLNELQCPRTCAAVCAALPFDGSVIHVRWSGEAVWAPLGDLDFGVPYEDPTSYPAPGQFLLFPGGEGRISETEILLAYGPCRFASKAGQLAGNPFATIVSGLDKLAELGPMTLQKGAQSLKMELIEDA